MRKKKTKLLTGDHSPKWYFFYSLSSIFIIAGFFYIFNFYAMVPQQTITGMQSLNVEFETVEDVLYQRYDVPEYKEQKLELTSLPYFLITVGIAGFLTTKFFYEKNNNNIVGRHRKMSNKKMVNKK